MFYIRLLTFSLLAMSLIPFCNPITSYGKESGGSLVMIMKDIGLVIKYFSTEIPKFSAYSNTLFVMCIFLYVALIGMLFGFLLTFSRDVSYKLHGLNSILYSSAGMSVVFIVLCFLYFNINITMYKLGSVAVYRKLLVIFRMPIFLIIFTIFSVSLFLLSMILRGFSFSETVYKIKSWLTRRFKGGVHVPYHKHTKDMAIEKLPPSKIMVYP